MLAQGLFSQDGVTILTGPDLLDLASGPGAGLKGCEGGQGGATGSQDAGHLLVQVLQRLE